MKPSSPLRNVGVASGQLVVVVLGLEEQLLSNQVDSEGDCCDAEAGEGALEAVPPCERAGVSPCLTAGA